MKKPERNSNKINLRSKIVHIIHHLAKTKYFFLVLVIFSYGLLTTYYMWPSIRHCTTTVNGFGDNTGGPIWKYSISPNNIMGGFENKTNYPFGESLASPVNYSATVQTVMIWASSKTFGPICGYNLINAFGFVFTATMMFGFIYSLTKKKWIALLAGYAVTFSPYYQVKVGGHPSYGYQGLLILTIWLFLQLLKKPQKLTAVLLGLVVTTSFYFDPYFVLLEAIVVGALGAAWLCFKLVPTLWLSYRQNRQKNKVVTQQFKMLLLSAVIVIVSVVPLLYVKVSNSKQIDSFVSSSRGNVLFEARACSNAPYEYLLPFVLHPAFNDIFGKQRYQKAIISLNNNFSCGIGEDSVGLSLTLVFIAGLGLLIFLWEKLNRRGIHLSRYLLFDSRVTLSGVLLIGIASIILGLPPLRFHHIPTPALVLLEITTTWRTLTRLYVLVNISLVIVLSIVLSYLAETFKTYRKTKVILFTLIFLLVFLEYQAFTPLRGNTLSTFNYKKSAPAAYYWLANQQDIKSVAEYPLERSGGESDASTYYLTMQTIHKKPLFNSALPNSVNEPIRSGLKNLRDPQTIQTLGALGVSAVIIHGVPEDVVKQIPGLEVVYSAPQAVFNMRSHTQTVKYDNIVVAKITSKPTNTTTLLELNNGFPRNAQIIKSAAEWEYEVQQDASIKVVAVGGSGGSTPQALQKVCFSMKMAAPTDTGELVIYSDGHESGRLMLSDEYQYVEVLAKSDLVLHNTNGHNMRVTNLGCNQ